MKSTKRIFIPFLLVMAALFALNLQSCKKKDFFTGGGALAFSRDTIVFDTVFTTIGSTTRILKIYNNQQQDLNIELVELMGGSSSPYRLNLDGAPGDLFSNIEIESGDSLFMFVEVTLNPNGGNLPMVVEDSIRFRTNGKDQFVQLAAWGQDMYYHFSNVSNGIFDLNEGTWPNDKPHVIYGAAFVDEGKSLTIQAGTQIYMHRNSFLYVYKGQIDMQGALGNEIEIQGDRLEQDYQDVSGQFYGVYLDSALSSTMNYVNIKNGITGIHIEGNHPTNTAPTLTLRNSKIQNCGRYGILNFFGGRLDCENTLIYKNGFHAFLNLAGGEFAFNHCFLLGYGTGGEQLPAVGVTNYYTDPSGTTNVFDVTARIHNSLIYGNQETEFSADTISGSGAINDFLFSYNFFKMSPITGNAQFSNMIWTGDPAFKDLAENDFTFWSTSALRDIATPAIPTSNGLDILGYGFNISTPDIGPYERF